MLSLLTLVAMLPAGESSVPALPMRVEWTAPRGCPDAERVRADVERLADRPLHSDPRATDALRGTITARDGGHHLDLVIRLRDSVIRRQLDAARCETLGHAASLIAAIAVAPLPTTDTVTAMEHAHVDEEGPLDAGVVPSPPEASQPTPRRRIVTEDRVPRAAAPDADAPPRAEPERAHALVLGAAVGVGLGLVSRPGLGLLGSLGWQFGGGRLELFGGHVFGRTAILSDDAGVTVAASGAGLRLGFGWQGDRIAVSLGLSAMALSLSASGQGAAVSPSLVRDLWVGIGPGAALSWAIAPRFGVRVGLDMLVGARRPGFHLIQGTTRREAFRSPPSSVLLTVGPYFRFP